MNIVEMTADGWAEFRMVPDNPRVEASTGVALLSGSTIVGLVHDDPYAHEGLQAATVAQMLTWAGIGQRDDVKLSQQQYDEALDRLREAGRTA